MMPPLKPPLRGIGEPPPWPAPPLYPGDWLDLPDDVVARTGSLLERFADARAFPNLTGRFLRMRALRLPFYPGWTLLEILGRPLGKRLGVARVLLGSERPLLLNGSAGILHMVNSKHLEGLDDPATVRHYLRFFCSCVHGEEGGGTRFQVVEGMDEIPPEMVRPGKVETVSAAVRPIEEVDGPSALLATLVYGGSLFRSLMRIDSSGMVVMEDDEPIAEDVFRLRECFDGPWQMHPHEIVPHQPKPETE
ncbi:hypothetical protein [Antarcticirhabdus aurantiaca]|uniref:Uncharacterized protein n=1 Tax=Antarcticirhabdus aurantiaca TaxID=2606717 RepID=A0ACD4NRM5_9HYPH|nr:hypothetical protein [Antarcticirhabdus aurantiaca]WAJ29449.1 hypothetical protein OXU80_04210 [Jeongeuplla avenae]